MFIKLHSEGSFSKQESKTGNKKKMTGIFVYVTTK